MSLNKHEVDYFFKLIFFPSSTCNTSKRYLESFQTRNLSYILTLLFSKHGLHPKSIIMSKLHFLCNHPGTFSVDLGGSNLQMRRTNRSSGSTWFNSSSCTTYSSQDHFTWSPASSALPLEELRHHEKPNSSHGSCMTLKASTMPTRWVSKPTSGSQHKRSCDILLFTLPARNGIQPRLPRTWYRPSGTEQGAPLAPFGQGCIKACE